MHRRQFLAATISAAAIRAATGPQVCLFTDHLSGFSYQEVARMLKDLGISGPDLTVRRGGIVPPEQAQSELPKALAVFKDHGLSIPMITTAITSLDEPNARPLLETAAKIGIRHYKLGYYRYDDLARYRETIAAARAKIAELANLNRKLGLRAGLHNHAGDSVGCCVWDAAEALNGADPKTIGFYFDPAQATIEGGKIGWNLAFRRAQSNLAMIAIKDFVWEKTAKGWRTRWVPLGEGMTDYATFRTLLKASAFQGPLSLHIEYDPGGKDKSERYDRALEAAARDLKFLREKILS
jgi:sugar phosphate isomerase/epimerase